MFEVVTAPLAGVVAVTLADHGLYAGSTFPVLVATSLYNVTLYGNYTVLDVISASVFTIQASTLASTITVTGASGTGEPDRAGPSRAGVAGGATPH